MIVLGFLAAWGSLYMGMFSGPDPAKPQITYGEFPFILEYKINGERKIIEDTLICEYDGITANEAVGKYREWKSYLASGNKEVTLLQIDKNFEVYYSIGSAGYYLGETNRQRSIDDTYNASYIKKKGNITSKGTIKKDELLETYGIEIINFEIAEPIKNTFITPTS